MPAEVMTFERSLESFSFQNKIVVNMACEREIDSKQQSDNFIAATLQENAKFICDLSMDSGDDEQAEKEFSSYVYQHS